MDVVTCEEKARQISRKAFMTFLLSKKMLGVLYPENTTEVSFVRMDNVGFRYSGHSEILISKKKEYRCQLK